MGSPEVASNYYILLLVGVVAIGLHAYGLFSQRVVDSNHSSMHRDLDLLPVIMISGKHDFSKGYILYLFAFEAVYIVLASSTTLLSFMLSLADQEDTVGALSSQIEPNAAIPVLASTALISLSQIKPFVSFENYIRDAFHGLSGVRTNARGVKDKIASTLARKMDDLEIDKSESFDYGKYSLLAAYRKKSQSVFERLIEDGVDEIKASTFAVSYSKVLYLHEVTLGYTGIGEWNREETSLIIEMFQALDYELDAMEALIRDYIGHSTKDGAPAAPNVLADENIAGSETARDGKRWKSVIAQCVTLEQRLLLLLALLFINRPDAELGTNILLKEIMHQSVTMREQRIGNLLLSSLIAGLAVSLFVLITYKSLIDLTLFQVRESPYENKLPFSTMIYTERVRTSLPLEELLFNGMNKEERQAASVSWMGMANKLGNNIRYWSYEIIKPALIYIVSAGVTLAYRNRAISERRWKPRLVRGHDNVPLLRYLSAGIYAYLATLSAVFFYYFVVLALIPSILSQVDFMTLAGTELLSATIPEIAYISTMAFVISYFVSYHCDFGRWNSDAKRAFYSIPKTQVLAFAALCGALNWIVKASLGSISSAWGVLDHFALPFLGISVFLSTFALFYCRYGEEEKPSHNSADKTWPWGGSMKDATEALHEDDNPL